MKKTRLAKIFLIVVLLPIFLFLFTTEVNAGCSFLYSNYTGCTHGTCYEGWCYRFNNSLYCYECYICNQGHLAKYACDNCRSCDGDCFVEGTSVASEQLSDQAIENLEPGDIVSSFNPETGEISESQVAEVHKITREGYYLLETESGKKVKVTGEHPFLAIKSEENLISKLKNVLSNTLTFRLITGLQTKLIEILD